MGDPFREDDPINPSIYAEWLFGRIIDASEKGGSLSRTLTWMNRVRVTLHVPYCKKTESEMLRDIRRRRRQFDERNGPDW